MGGSFDPPHKTHIALARAAAESLGLDRVFFIPAFASPLKPAPHSASYADRRAMLELALESFPHPREILDVERDRGGESYSVDTARELASRFPGDVLYWIIGSDQLMNLGLWRDISALARLVRFACASRPGYPFAVPRDVPAHAVVERVEFAESPASSSGLRAALERGDAGSDFIDGSVLKYIKEHKLYASE